MSLFPDWRDGTDGCNYVLSKYCFRMRKMVSKPGHFLFVNAAPKSGSTYLINILIELTGYQRAHLVSGYKDNVQDLYLPRVLDCYSRKIVVHQHVIGSDRNIDIMRASNIRPIIHIRNIFDCIVSLRDYFRNAEVPRMFFADLVSNYHQLNENQQIDMLIDFAAPWYINYFVTWTEAERRGDVEMLWTTYEDLVENPIKFLDGISKWYGLDEYSSNIESVLELVNKGKRQNRFNKGIIGRGENILSDSQKKRIINLTKYYPEIDFNLIGI